MFVSVRPWGNQQMGLVAELAEMVILWFDF